MKITISLFLLALVVLGAFIFKDFLNEEIVPKSLPIVGKGERKFQFEDEGNIELPTQLKNTAESFHEIGKLLEAMDYSPKVTDVKKNGRSYFVLSSTFPLGDQDEIFDVTTTLHDLDQATGQLENLLKVRALLALEKKFQEINPPLIGKVRFSLVSDSSIEDYLLRVLRQNSKKRGVIRFDLSCAQPEKKKFSVTQTATEVGDTFESPALLLTAKTTTDAFVQATSGTFDFEKVERKMDNHDLPLVQIFEQSPEVCKGNFDEFLSPTFHLLTTFLRYDAPEGALAPPKPTTVTPTPPTPGK